MTDWLDDPADHTPDLTLDQHAALAASILWPDDPQLPDNPEETDQQ